MISVRFDIDGPSYRQHLAHQRTEAGTNDARYRATVREHLSIVADDQTATSRDQACAFRLSWAGWVSRQMDDD